MRTLARRFSATCYYKEEITQLRVLPQPLYRFSDEKRGIVDGALFALVVSNDAELLLLLEAAGDRGGEQILMAIFAGTDVVAEAYGASRRRRNLDHSRLLHDSRSRAKDRALYRSV